MYSAKISLTLGSMVLSGALRSVAVKVFFQMGFEKPFFVTLLFHIAGLPAFVVYYLRQRRKRRLVIDENSLSRQEAQSSVHATTELTRTLTQRGAVSSTDTDENTIGRRHVSFSTRERDAPSNHSMGSQTGITEESHTAAASLLNRIRPRYLQLILPGVLDLFAYLLRWGAFLYVPASVAEMLMNGFELVLSAVTSRVIRKRRISCVRWAGVGIVVVGIVVIGVADTLSLGHGRNTSSGPGGTVVGIALIVGAAVFGTGLAMAEEILTQEGGHDVLIVMGNEGLWGLFVGLILYFPMSPLFDEDPSETWKALGSPTKMLYSVGLVFLFTVAGMLSIYSIALTSTMSKNIWQHLRSIPVWIINLVIYYSMNGDKQLGEPWLIPHSLFVLLGFVVMMVGVCIYYHKHS